MQALKLLLDVFWSPYRALQQIDNLLVGIA
jgi:hypothetical protein